MNGDSRGAPPLASPVPTTMMVSLRRFAGFTRRAENLRCDHFFSMGPAGAFVSRMSAPTP